MTDIQRADSEAALRRCFPVMVQLRPHLDEGAFLRHVRVQAGEGYHVVFLERNGRVTGVAGYRIQHMLHQGKLLYVDDLVTDEKARSTGVGGTLLEWLAAEARRNDCDGLELDSGVQRVGAHRFYLMSGLHIASYHFRLPLKSEPPRLLGSMPTGAAPQRRSAGARAGSRQ